MTDALIHFLFFVGEIIIIVAAILILFAGILSIACKNKLKDKGKLKINKLNAYYEELAEKMQEAVLTKPERKKITKEKKKAKKQEKKEEIKKRIYLLDFIGDIKASAVESLREEITALLMIAKKTDEVILKLESPGGVVHGYGLAASELQRIKNHGIPLTITVDKVAASGGYMMACVADKILAAPFSIIGSIGVLAQIPNFHRLLKKHDVDFEQICAGEYKRTLSLFGENTSKGRKKMQEEVEEAHDLFKTFIQDHRPQVNIENVSTGEHWFGKRALELKLIDAISTSDDYLMEAQKEAEIFKLSYKKRAGMIDKLFHLTQNAFGSVLK